MESQDAPAKSINKTQLIQVISDRLDVTRIVASRFLEVLADVAQESLQRDKILIIPDIVQLTVKTSKGRSAHKGTSFQGEPCEWPATPPKTKVYAKPLGLTKKAAPDA